MNIFKFKQKKEKGLPGSAFRTRKTTTGFTLIELLVVISIIGFLSSVVIASVRSSRERAKDAKIAEDLRQVRTAAELYYTDKQSYKFTTFDNINKDILVDNDDMPTLKDFNPFSIKTANADWPTACTLFNNIAGNLVALKYLAAMPVHPRQNEADGICYKAATTTDGLYAAVWGELSSTVLIGGVSTPKNTGFIVGDTSVGTLQAIYTASGNKFPATASINTAPSSISSIVDQVQGITNGTASGGGVSEPPSAPTTYTLYTSPAYDNKGEIERNPDKVAYNPGENVLINVSPDFGYYMSYWYDELGGYVPECQTDAESCTIQMNSNRTVRPNFRPYTRTLRVSIPYPYGSVDNDNSTYNHGEVATINATPYEGVTFNYWSGPNGWQCNDPYSTTCEITMDGDKNIDAMFYPPF